MTGFKEHVLAKYFAYRRRYVDHIVREAPQRASLAVLSEVARLAFSTLANALLAAIFWALCLGASARGGGLWPWPVLFGALGCMPTVFGVLAASGLVTALGDRRRVLECVAGARAPRP